MMISGVDTRTPQPRADFELEPIDASDIGEIERSLSFTERLIDNDAARRLAILVVLGLIWELYARWVDNPLILPTLGATLTTFFHDIASGVLIDRIATSLRSLMLGYLAGLLLAAALTTIAVSTRIGYSRRSGNCRYTKIPIATA